jgi:hypothetical protein
MIIMKITKELVDTPRRRRVLLMVFTMNLRAKLMTMCTEQEGVLDSIIWLIILPREPQD